MNSTLIPLRPADLNSLVAALQVALGAAEGDEGAVAEGELGDLQGTRQVDHQVEPVAVVAGALEPRCAAGQISQCLTLRNQGSRANHQRQRDDLALIALGMVDE